MKILHVFFSFPPDGAEAMLVDIMNEQSKTNHVELIIVNNLYNEKLIATINKNVKVHCLNRTVGSHNPIKIIQFNIKVLKIQPNIIHFHDHNGIRLLLFKGKAQTFLTIHGLQNPMTYLRKYDKLISISDIVRNDLLRRGGLKSLTIYNGINFSSVSIRNQFNSSNVFKIVQIGRLYHGIKGQDILIKALNHIVYERGIKNVRLDFIGEGPSLNYLKDLVTKLKLEAFVSFTGLKTRQCIYQHLANYDLLVQPSIHEGFGLAIVEGMAAKLPVLISDIDGPLQIIKNGKYGNFFIRGDYNSCAKEIERIILEKDKPEFERELNCAYEYALNNFSVINTANRYLHAYNTSFIS